MQVGNIVLRKPELVDYEKKTFYALLITATDLVIPEIERKTVYTFKICFRECSFPAVI